MDVRHGLTAVLVLGVIAAFGSANDSVISVGRLPMPGWRNVVGPPRPHVDPGATPADRPLPIVQVVRRPVRIVLASERELVHLTEGGMWRLTDSAGRVVTRAPSLAGWSIERRGRRVRSLSADGAAGAWVDGALQLRPGAADDTEGMVTWGSRHYRGALAFAATDSSILVLNVVDVEEYLRGVVPLEIGARSSDEHAAVEAQAVAARSFTYERMAANIARPYDLTTRESDQVYGGADVETPLGSLAVDATAGVLLTFAGRPVNAPYHSTCGGSTADPREVWRERGASYLRGVSDLVPGTSRAWCDISPRSRWERTYTASSLRAAINKYLGAYATVPAGDLGALQGIAIEGNTPSGRVAEITLALDAGRFRLRGNDIRYVMRSVGGEILPSTYFSLEPVMASGRLTQLIVRGRGNGHGVGMCQWGAIGRARAGADFRAILRAYFPGTELARAS